MKNTQYFTYRDVRNERLIRGIFFEMDVLQSKHIL